MLQLRLLHRDTNFKPRWAIIGFKWTGMQHTWCLRLKMTLIFHANFHRTIQRREQLYLLKPKLSQPQQSLIFPKTIEEKIFDTKIEHMKDHFKKQRHYLKKCSVFYGCYTFKWCNSRTLSWKSYKCRQRPAWHWQFTFSHQPFFFIKPQTLVQNL